MGIHGAYIEQAIAIIFFHILNSICRVGDEPKIFNSLYVLHTMKRSPPFDVDDSDDMLRPWTLPNLSCILSVVRLSRAQSAATTEHGT